jgi:dTDP-glucose 4,6-dehydratase
MKWLVTGACGFIGSNFVRMLLEKGEEVCVVDLLTYAGDKENIAGLDVEFMHVDIADPLFMEVAVKDFKPDIVVNFAAESHVDRSIENSADFIHSNINGVAVLLDLALKHGFKLVQVSTDEVYGSVEQQDDYRFTEEMNLIPNSPYSASKASADLLLMSYVHTHKIDATIRRYSNNYGPFQHPEKMMPKCIINSFTGEDIPLYGDGLNVRDWIYVEDHCRGIYEASVCEFSKGEIYNFGGATELTNRELVDKIINAAGGKPEQIKMVEDRKGHDRTYGVNFSKAETCLCWRPQVDFDEGLNKTIEWYKKNQKWWKGKL